MLRDLQAMRNVLARQKALLARQRPALTTSERAHALAVVDELNRWIPLYEQAIASATSYSLPAPMQEKIAEGQWAAERDSELQRLNRRWLRSPGTHENELRKQFPKLWSDVIDKFPKKRRNTIITHIRSVKLKQPDRYDIIAEAIEKTSGDALYPSYKAYRTHAGLKRTRRPSMKTPNHS